METLLKQPKQELDLNVHILKTNVKNRLDLEAITIPLNTHRSIVRWSIDLQDWEKVLKVVGTNGLRLEEIVGLLRGKGFFGKALDH